MIHMRDIINAAFLWRQRLHRVAERLFRKILRILDETNYDENGLPLLNPHGVRTLHISPNDYLEMLAWIEANVHGPMSTSEYGCFWEPKHQILAAHRRSQYPFRAKWVEFGMSFKRAAEYRAFVKRWGHLLATAG